jgi:cell division protein FtsW
MRTSYGRTTPALSGGPDTIETRAHKPDYLLPLLSALLLALGFVIVFSISPGIASIRNVSEGYIINKQLLSIVLGVIGFTIAATLPVKFWKSISVSMLLLGAVSSFVVFVFGEEINGAKRWITIGGLSFQVAELIKLSLAIWLALFLASSREKLRSKTGSDELIKQLGIAVAIIAVVVAGLQSDLGSAAVMLSMITGGAFIAGLRMQKLLLGGVVVVLVVGLAISMSGYRRQRLQTFLNPESDCQAAGYQACQALITVGSGGVFGTGLSKGAQAYGYLPEAANDSIFAVIAEKIGFMGSSLLLAVYTWLLLRLQRIAEKASDYFSMVFVSLVMIWLGTQTFINVGAMVGLLPLKGITLPFISYGGTSLLFVMIALGIVFRISKHTSLSGRARRSELRRASPSTYRGVGVS